VQYFLNLKIGSGKVYSFGNNFYGQLGIGHFKCKNHPVEVSFPNHEIIKICVGYYHSMALTSNFKPLIIRKWSGIYMGCKFLL